MSEPDDTPTFPDEGRITEVSVNGQKIYLPFDGVLVKKGDLIEVVGGVELRISQPTFEPDDTPTRLQHFIRQHQHGNCHILSKGDACECALCDLDRLLADVSRLREAKQRLMEARVQAVMDIHIALGTEPSGDMFERIKQLRQAEADVSRLQQEIELSEQGMTRLQEIGSKWQARAEAALEENALLRRSLEMLTKQLDERDTEIAELKECVYHLMPPRTQPT